MNYYGIYPENDYRYYLQHHGILGQKWGERNGPPYPLKTNQHSTSENKAGWRKSISGASKNISQSEKKDDGFVAIPAAIYAYKKIKQVKQQHDTVSAYKKRDAAFLSRSGPIDKETGFRIKTNKEPVDIDIKNVNPGYKKGVKSLNNNCVSCGLAFELRRRGFDVMAKKSDYGVDGEIFTLDSFKNVKPKLLDRTGILNKPKSKEEWQYLNFNTDNWVDAWQEASSAAKKGKDREFSSYLQNTLKKEKNSRGNLFIQWGAGGGHTLSYEVKGGKVTLFDAQINKIYRTDSEIDKILSHAWTGVSMRLDNCEINAKEIKKHVV